MEKTKAISHERRRVFDLAPIKVEITEHQAENLSQYRLLPYERGIEWFTDLFRHQLSQTTLVNADQTHEILEPVEKEDQAANG